MTVQFKDFTKDDGTIDWPAYHQAQVDNGEKCYRCGAYTSIFGASGKRRLCTSCVQLDQSMEDVEHGTLVRCPSCCHLDRADDLIDDHVDGEQEVRCSACDYRYVVQIEVTYRYISPERK